MGINQLPTELHWLIASHLPTLGDVRSLSLASKTTHALLDDLCYKKAIEKNIPVLGWAIQVDVDGHCRASAAKKYLRLGGGKTDGRTQTLGKKHMNVLNLTDRKLRRTLKDEPGTRLPYDDLTVRTIKTEIGIVLAQLFRSEGSLTRSAAQRLAWIELIFQHAQKDAIGPVERSWLLRWMCRHFDHISDVTTRSFRAMVLYLSGDKGKRIVANQSLAKPLDPGDDAVRHGQDSGLSRHSRALDASWSWITHVLRSLESIDGPSRKVTPAFKAFIETLIDSDIARSGVEEVALSLLIEWHQSYSESYPLLRATVDELTTSILLILTRQLMKQDKVDPSSEVLYLGQTALLHAAWLNNEGIVQTLLDMGVDINSQSARTGKTAIMMARSHSMFNFLRSKGADLKARDKAGFSNLVTSTILQRHAVIASIKGSRDELFEADAPFLGRLSLVLCSNHDLLNSPAKQGGPLPVYLAMCGGEDRKMVWKFGLELLLGLGANTNLPIQWQRRYYRTGRLTGPIITTYFIHVAILEGKSKALVKQLLKFGADPNMRDSNGIRAHDLPEAANYQNLLRGR